MTPEQIHRYRALLLILARKELLHMRLQKRLDASDLVQETLLQAYANRAQYKGKSEPELIGWLQKILAHRLADEADKAHAKKRDLTREESIQKSLSQSTAKLYDLVDKKIPSPSEDAQRREFFDRVTEAVTRLPEDQRDVVILRDLMGTPVAEIAALVEKSEKAVAGLLFRGRQTLRKELSGYQ